MAITVPKDGDIISASTFGAPVATGLNLLDPLKLFQSVSVTNVNAPASVSSTIAQLTIPAASIPNGRPYFVWWAWNMRSTNNVATSADFFADDGASAFQIQQALSSNAPSAGAYSNSYVGAGAARTFKVNVFTWAGQAVTFIHASIMALILPS